ncbi:MFS transporter [uncultured Cohaesibacter sp.]|uniref:MFS transporter n=1 Tax=uncultured Cohaesibacter sp. TaxID=1002546 RepID=UPI00292FEDB5|nr:MFS transporter [uncultured Cohaesibacter sp.]
MPNQYLVLVMVFTGSFANAATMPFIGLFIIEDLNRSPLMISVFSVLATTMTILANRYVGQGIDNGWDIRRLLMVSILSYLVAMGSLLIYTSYWTLITIYALCLAIANTAPGTILSFARFYSDQNKLDTAKFNSRVRAMMSLAWMIAPALCFALAGILGHMIVFQLAFAVGCLWLLAWFITFRQPFRRTWTSNASLARNEQVHNFNFPLMAATIACFFISLGNALALASSPLFLIKEAHLPEVAPGLSLTVKCFFEVIIILGTPKLLKRFGSRNAMILAGFLGVVCYCYLSTVSSMAEMVLAAAIEGTYFGIFAAVSITFMQSFARGFIGNAMSLYTNSMALSGLFGGSIMGIIASISDYRTAVLSSSVALIAAIITLVVTRGTDRQSEEQPAS